MSSASTTTSASFTGQVLFCPTAEICQRHLVTVPAVCLPSLPQASSHQSVASPLSCDGNSNAVSHLKLWFSHRLNKSKRANFRLHVFCCSNFSFLTFVLQSAKSLQGNKDSRILWVKDDFLLTTGFDMVRNPKVITSLFLFSFPLHSCVPTSDHYLSKPPQCNTFSPLFTSCGNRGSALLFWSNSAFSRHLNIAVKNTGNKNA